jgi:hypothetical protein
MPSKTSLEDEFVKQVENEEAKFDDDTCPLRDDQLAAFHSCCELFQQDLTLVSKAQRYRVLRTRKLLRDVFLHIGVEVFLLCSLATSITVLGKLDLEDLFPKLRRWWKSVTTRTGLRETARKLCADNKVSDLVGDTVTDNKGQRNSLPLEITANQKNVGSSSRKRARSSDASSFEIGQRRYDSGSDQQGQSPRGLHQLVSDQSPGANFPSIIDDYCS